MSQVLIPVDWSKDPSGGEATHYSFADGNICNFFRFTDGWHHWEDKAWKRFSEGGRRTHVAPSVTIAVLRKSLPLIHLKVLRIIRDTLKVLTTGSMRMENTSTGMAHIGRTMVQP